MAQGELEDAQWRADYFWDRHREALLVEDHEGAADYARLARRYEQEVAELGAQIVAERGNVDNAAFERDVAAQRAIAEIEAITSSDGLNDSWWDNWGSKVVTVITQVSELVATVAGIAGMLLCWVPGLGAALLAISAVAGVVAAVGSAALALGGDESWRAALLGIGFGLLGCLGLGGLRGILGSVRVAGQFVGKGGASALQGAFRSGLPGLKASVSGVAGRIKTVANQMKNPAPKPVSASTTPPVPVGPKPKKPAEPAPEGTGAGLNKPEIVRSDVTTKAAGINLDNGAISDKVKAVLKRPNLPPFLKRIFEGIAFDQIRKKEMAEQYMHQVRLKSRKVVDAYLPRHEIIERKFTELSEIKISTAIRYLDSLLKKYPIDSPMPNGDLLRGKHFLEVPIQEGPIPQQVLDFAHDHWITIRDVNGTIYT